MHRLMQALFPVLQSSALNTEKLGIQPGARTGDVAALCCMWNVVSLHVDMLP